MFLDTAHDVRSPNVSPDRNRNPTALPTGGPVPLVPEDVEDTRLEFGFLADLTLKAVDSGQDCTTVAIAERLKLPRTVTEVLLTHLHREKLIEIRERVGLQNGRYAMLERGWERQKRILETNGYIGPAPVPLEAYTEMVHRQEALKEPIDLSFVHSALSHLVLPEDIVETLAMALNSRRSLFLTGPPGNGKTSIAKALRSAMGGEIWIPYAIEIDGQVIKVFDAHNHRLVSPPTAVHDTRWVKIERPLIVVGGELTIEDMELIYNRAARYYEAPFQVKSNGGILIIDDFGRQRIEPRDLLNRWIVPLEDRIDYLTLHTGKKLQVPFEQLLIFATNLRPQDLVDEAFLRRIGYRLKVDSPSVETFRVIFQKYIESCGLNYEPSLLDKFLMLYQENHQSMSACHPRDIVERCRDVCRYINGKPEITSVVLEKAWDGYFGARDL